jgi:hypothetical protein
VVSLPRFEPTSGEVGARLPLARPQTKFCVTCTEAPESRPLRPFEFEVQHARQTVKAKFLFIPGVQFRVPCSFDLFP